MLKFDNKGYFYTYSQCPLSKQKVLETIQNAWLLLNKKVQNYVVCEEKHEDGNPHLHAFISLDRPFRGQVDARFCDVEGYHPSIETVRKTPEACIAYCQKDSNYLTNMALDKKVTKEDIAKELMSGKPLVEIVQTYPKYLFGYSRLKQDLFMYQLDLKKLEPLLRPCGIWIGGPSGCGKSTIATTKFGAYYFKDKTKWWDGYNGEDTVVCEDVDLSWKDCFPYFKIWADRYQFNGEVKGGTVNLRPKRIIVTSNRTLEELLELMQWPKDDYIPYTRRFNQYWITSLDDWESQL